MRVRPDFALLVFGTNRPWIALALTGLVATMASVGHAAIIGPTNDWVSITERPKEWNISDEMIDEILAAGLNLYCEGSENANPTALNAWLLSGDRTTITTAAHAFYDERGKERAPLGECYAQSLADVLDSIENPNPIRKTYIDAASVRVGTTLPNSSDPPHDRAVATLKKPLSASKPIGLPQAIPELKPGDDIFVVSRKPGAFRSGKADREPVIFKITTFKLIPTWEGLPGGILSDVDDVRGDSGGLYLVRDPADAERLIPIGITHGSFEQVTPSGTVVDNLPYKPFKNSAIGIFLDEFFYDGLR